jgi:GNAT superfamily N-acetyltransferase
MRMGDVPHNDIRIRLAVAADVPALRKLIEESVRVLQAQDYTQMQMEGALKTVFGVDSQLIADGTYFVAESQSDFTPAGCGGWSKRRTLFGGDQWTERGDDLLDPAREAAKIRALFVHPRWARRGIGGMILKTCEDAASVAGFQRFEMGATLTGVKLFSAQGYVAQESIEIPLGNGATLPVVRMGKMARVEHRSSPAKT